MKIFEKIGINLKDGKTCQFKIIGVPIIQYDIIKNCKTKYYIPFLQKKIVNKEKPVFYLKVNRDDYLAFNCLQRWIDIVAEIGADFFILCDKSKINKQILKKVVFHNSNIKFLKSCKNNYLKKIILI